MGRYEKEFHDAGEPISRRVEKTPPKVDAVILASQSLRRRSAVEHALQRLVITVPGGPENPYANPMEIAKGKIRHAKYLLPSLKLVRPQDRLVFVAADVVSRPSGKNKKDVFVTKQKGKPNDSSVVQAVFKDMLETNHTYYIVHAGAGVEFPGSGKYDRSIPLSSTVTLDPDVVKYFATDKGIKDYVKMFEDFHSSDLYLDLGRHKPVSITDASAGLSGPVLMKSGAITAVDFVTLDDPNFRENYMKYLYTSFVGIHPAVLNAIDPQAEERLKNWPFLNAVTNETMAARGL